MRTTFLALAFAAAAFAQTTPAPTSTVSIAVPIPAGILVFGAYNQLGTPKFTGGVSAIYPIIGSAGIYGTTTTDILPRKAVDPTTGRSFYAISTSLRQGFHKSLISTGAFTFLLGADVGPTFSETTANVISGKPATISVSLSTSATATLVYQFSPLFSFAMPVRMLYESGIGWNPVIEAGFVINLQKLPAKK